MFQKSHTFKFRHFFLVLGLTLSSFISISQIPRPALVGYWENWGTMKLTDIHENYNIIQIAFATTQGSSLYDMEFNRPYWYTKTAFIADAQTLQAEGKKIILSIGGATDPVRISNQTEYNTFVSSMKQIMDDYDYLFDGIDIDLESTSFNFGAWTMASLSDEQDYLVEAIRELMAYYQAEKGQKLLLTMAPESIYLVGALSNTQLNSYNGGAMLPIIGELEDEIDLLHVQYYNANESIAIDGGLYQEGTGDYLTAVTESIIKGFTLLGGKGTYYGIDANKVAIGLPAGQCSGGGGYVAPAEVTKAVKYLRGEIPKPSGWNYTLLSSYPDLAGLMTWSVNKDMALTTEINGTQVSCSGEWTFADGFKDAFPEDVVFGLANNSKEETFSISPNPTTNNIRIFSEKTISDVIIYSILGEKIETIKLPLSGVIDLSTYKKGVYLIEINGNVQRLVKQ